MALGRTPLILIPLLLAMLPGAVARADEQARAVTLAQAQAAATATPGARAAVTRSQAAESAIGAAGAWPPFAFSVGTTKSTAHAIVTAGIPLPIFGTIGAERDVARAEYAGAQAEAAVFMLEARQRITAAWIQLARAEARARISAEIAANEAQLADVTRKRADAGDASRADVLTAETSALRMRTDAASAADAVGVFSAELAALLGWDPEAGLHAEGGLPRPLVTPVGPAASTPQHPDARAAEARVATELAHIEQAHRARYPQLGLDLEADIDDPTLPGTDLRAGLSFAVPLLGHGGDAQRAAELRHEAAQHDRTSTLSALRGRQVVAARRSRAAAARALALDEQVVPAQRDAAALARISYREGQARLLDVLAANRALADAEADAIDALAEAALARSELEQALGGTP